MVAPIFAGRLTDSIGGKWIAFCCMFLPFLLSLATPLLIVRLGPVPLVAIQAIIGGCHSCLYPALLSLYVKWFPSEERANANAALLYGSNMGSAFMFLVAGYLCHTPLGWPLVFYVTAALHVPWLFAWWYYASNEPFTNKRILDSELKYITSNVEQRPSMVSSS